MNRSTEYRVAVGALALLAGLLVGCQSGEDTSTPPTSGMAPAPSAAGDPGIPPGMTGAPPMPVGPTVASKSVRRPARTSFDQAPEGMQGLPANGGSAPASGQPGGIPGAVPGGEVGKPRPIVAGLMPKGRRPDPFVSFYRLVVERQPAYTLAVPMRLASYPKIQDVPKPVGVDALLPLPQVARRVAGVLYNGAITAILETGDPPNSVTNIIAPGATVPSGVPGIPDLTVDSIAMDRLVLRAPDGRTAEVKLSGLAPAVLDSMRGQFGGGGVGGMMGGGMSGSGPMGPGMGGRGAVMGGGGGIADLQ